MRKPPPITDAEWQIMNVIWDRGSATAEDVVEALESRQDWHPRTIKTLLGRLLKKGALRHRTEGNRYIYLPRFTRAECLREASGSFLNRVFDGDAFAAVVHLAKTGKLSEKDLDRLREILREDKP